MSIVDGCVLVVCSGADGRFRSLADWTDWSASPGHTRPCWAVLSGYVGTGRSRENGNAKRRGLSSP
jgi:hypothetical protein